MVTEILTVSLTCRASLKTRASAPCDYYTAKLDSGCKDWLPRYLQGLAVLSLWNVLNNSNRTGSYLLSHQLRTLVYSQYPLYMSGVRRGSDFKPQLYIQTNWNTDIAPFRVTAGEAPRVTR